MDNYTNAENTQEQNQQQYINVEQLTQPIQPQQYNAPVQPVPQSQENNLRVTSLNDLQSYKRGTVVRLPDFADGQELIVRLVRPSMLILSKSGKIPNELLATGAELFNTSSGQSLNANNANLLSDMYDLMHIIAEASLVEPTLQEIESTGINLTDEQLSAIFSYSQNGVKALKHFR